MSKFHCYIDNYMYNNFYDYFNPDRKFFSLYYIVPLKEKLKFVDNNKKVVELYKFPKNYRHSLENEFRYSLAGYSCFMALICFWKLVKNIRSQNIFFGSFWGALFLPTTLSSHYAWFRVKDVK